ncbi:MAG: GntR family transcriptional regulator [Oscillospiraceae bacterium]|nr:GntR family transcriptional regulator [Oscillospiraceae bacterium]
MIIQIDVQSPEPIYEQLRNQIVFGIASGQLLPGESIPPIRRLAADLGINLHTVNKAYTMLCVEGYLVMDRRKGAVVSVSDGNGDSERKLTKALTLSAAEARCKGMELDAFLSLCKLNYEKVK